MTLRQTRYAAGGWVIVALLLAPVPLLPPHGWAEVVRSWLGIGWKPAYLVSALGLQLIFYAPLGVFAMYASGGRESRRERMTQCVRVPLLLVAGMLLIRSVKLGHWPVLTNAATPILACVFGVGIGAVLWYCTLRTTLLVLLLAGGMLGLAWWGLFGTVSSKLAVQTRARLERLVEEAPGLPRGPQRFGALVRSAFEPLSSEGKPEDPVLRSRAAILALGIALGHDRVARFIGLKWDSDLVRRASRLRYGASMRGRRDWTRHFCLSAGLAVLENPFLSEAGGLMKEQIDVHASSSGFSFTDLAADRAGVLFADAATASREDAMALQARLHDGFEIDDYLPPLNDLPEGLSIEELNRDYGGIGTARYREMLARIDERLAQCKGLKRAGRSGGGASPKSTIPL